MTPSTSGPGMQKSSVVASAGGRGGEPTLTAP